MRLPIGQPNCLPPSAKGRWLSVETVSAFFKPGNLRSEREPLSWPRSSHTIHVMPEIIHHMGPRSVPVLRDILRLFNHDYLLC